MKRCLFCNNPANSKEHVISKRLAKRMRISDGQVTVGALTESRGYEARKKHSLLGFETRRVCRTCNNGWMNALEAFVEESLGPLIEPTWPPASPEILATVLTRPASLLRWLANTACIVQEAGVLHKEVIHGAMMRQVPTLEPRTGIHMFAGFIRERNLDVRLEKGFRIWEHGQLYPNREHKDGFSFAVQLNHLALRLLIAPGSETLFVMPYGPSRETVPIHLALNMSPQGVAQHTYDSMTDFYACVDLRI